MQMEGSASTDFMDGSRALEIARQLEQAGLNLSVLMDASKIDDPAIPAPSGSLLLVGSYGNKLWNCIPADDRLKENPVDDFSLSMISQTLTSVIGNTDWQILYPNQSPSLSPRLQRLGLCAGWHHPSPLGSGIHPEHGLWFAYRAVAYIKLSVTEIIKSVTSAAPGLLEHEVIDPPQLIDSEVINLMPVDSLGKSISQSPCLSCVDQPCIAACPASALSYDDVPDLNACVTYRTSAQSPCAERCLAREQCPIGIQYRYTDEQIRYFYQQSLSALQLWVAQAAAAD